jgi:O-antigen ligase
MAWTARPHRGARIPARAAPWDLAGLTIVCALAAWTVVAALGRQDARPFPVLALLAGSTGFFTAARLWSRRNEALVPQAVAVATAGAFLLTYPGVLSSGGAPTGYANANGTLAGLGVIAAGAAIAAARGVARRGWTALMLLLLACVVLSGSAAAVAALGAAAVLAVLSLVRRDVSVASLGGLVATWLAVGVTAAVAAGSTAGHLHIRDEVRTDLWSQALDLTRDAPLRGHGPGSFVPPVPLLDADLRWAHHGYLQQAAEVGAVGLVLLLLLVGWLFAYLWWRGRRGGRPATIAGACAVTLVALHASVDHVLHTAVVPLTLAVLGGWATAHPLHPGSQGSRRPHR